MGIGVIFETGGEAGVEEVAGGVIATGLGTETGMVTRIKIWTGYRQGYR